MPQLAVRNHVVNRSRTCGAFSNGQSTVPARLRPVFCQVRVMQVQWDNLSPQELEDHALWRYVDPSDGEYVTPINAASLDEFPLNDILLATRFRFRDGTEHIGFVHGTEGAFEFSERSFGSLSPYVVLPNGHSLNLFAFPPRNLEPYQDIQMDYRARWLGCGVLDIYPIGFTVISPIDNAISHGVIPGLMFYRIFQKQTLFRRSKTVLLTRLPDGDSPQRNSVSDNPYHPPQC